MRFLGAIGVALLLAACSPTVSNPTSGPTGAPAGLPSASPPPSQAAAPSATGGASLQPSAAPSEPAAASVVWHKLEPADAPAAREDHTWTLDPGARVAYLFGGRDGPTVHDDLWAFDLETDTWRRLEPAGRGPDARFGHEAVWVDDLGLVVWAGQAGPTTFFDDLWAYDPAANAWDRLPNDGDRPIARYGSCAALGPDGRLWISHGFTSEGSRFADTRAYDFETGRWTDETPAGRAQPVARCLHACWWTDGGRFALYAGQTTGVRALGDLWTLDTPGTQTAAWTRVEGALPEDRHLYALTRHGDAFVVLGGRGLDGEGQRDGYLVDATTLRFDPLEANGARPPGRWGGALVDDPTAGRVILFGGTTGRRALDDTWELRLP